MSPIHAVTAIDSKNIAPHSDEIAGTLFPDTRSKGLDDSQLPWDISAAEFAQSNKFFDQLDSSRQGFISGDQAVPFLMESKLPANILAQVWDLADIRGEGRLSREEFAVALRLIQDNISGQTLPTVLSIGMIPPSLRRSIHKGSLIDTVPLGVAGDMISLMDDDPALPADPQSHPPLIPPTMLPQPTGASAKKNSNQDSPSPFLSALQTAPKDGGFPFDKGQNSSQAPAPNYAPVDELATSLNEPTARIGILQNQLQSTESATSVIKAQKASVEQDQTSTEAGMRELELKIATAKAIQVTESRLLDDLRSKMVEQSAQMTKLREDVIRAESELSAMKLERSELEGALLRDKEEVRVMKARLSQLQEETASFRSQLDILRKDARQQKGLLAISKKQVSTSESEHQSAREELNGLASAASQDAPIGSAKTFAEPALVSPSTTNPFEKILASTSISPGRENLPTSSGLSTATSSSLTFMRNQKLSEEPSDFFGRDIFAPSSGSLELDNSVNKDVSQSMIQNNDKAARCEEILMVDPEPHSKSLANAVSPPQHSQTSVVEPPDPHASTEDQESQSSDDDTIEDAFALRPNSSGTNAAASKFPALDPNNSAEHYQVDEHAHKLNNFSTGVANAVSTEAQNASPLSRPSTSQPFPLEEHIASMSSSSAVNDDWESAFASLPSARKVSTNDSVGHVGDFFDDAVFDSTIDDFRQTNLSSPSADPIEAKENTTASTTAVATATTTATTGFEDSFADFDNHFLSAQNSLSSVA